MVALTQRLELTRLSIADQADYLQQILQQFDMPYDACCSLQMAVADLRQASGSLDCLARNLDKELRQPRQASPRRRG